MTKRRLKRFVVIGICITLAAIAFISLRLPILQVARQNVENTLSFYVRHDELLKLSISMVIILISITTLLINVRKFMQERKTAGNI